MTRQPPFFLTFLFQLLYLGNLFATQSPLVSTESDPDAFIQNCVNVINGDYCESTTEVQPSKAEQLVNATLDSAAKTIQKKDDVKVCGMGAAMPGGPIRQLTLCFDTKRPFTKQQLRALLINAANELLHKIDENKEIQEFMKERPFTIKNTEVIIYNHDETGRELCDPEVSVARISDGLLIYRKTDPEDSFKYKSKDQENYEEALRVLSTD